MIKEKARVLLISGDIPLCNTFKKIGHRIPEIDVVDSVDSATTVQFSPTAPYHCFLLDNCLADNEIRTFFSLMTANNIMAPVIVITRTDTIAMEKALTVLEMGALDLIPSPLSEPRVDLEEILQELQLRTRCISSYSRKKAAQIKVPEKALLKHIEAAPNTIQTIAIGAAEGGVSALYSLMRSFKTRYSLPFLVVLQLHKSLIPPIAVLLEQKTKFSCSIATHHAPILPGNIILAPGDQQMGVINCEDQCLIELTYEDRVSERLPSMDYLFRSLSDSFAENTLALLLSGSGEDGISGLRLLKSKDGLIICQSPDTAFARHKIYLALQQGIIDETIRLEKLGRRIQEIVRESRK